MSYNQKKKLNKNKTKKNIKLLVSSLNFTFTIFKIANTIVHIHYCSVYLIVVYHCTIAYAKSSVMLLKPIFYRFL